eukprot:scaffold81879_cov33-Phaeocystis_antarctica.AAC.1
MYWSQTESSKRSPKSLSFHPRHPADVHEVVLYCPNSHRVYNFSPEWTGRKGEIEVASAAPPSNAFALLAAHALNLSPHDARRATCEERGHLRLL